MTMTLYRPLEERFHERVERTEGGCWLWQGARRNGGYGVINPGRDRHDLGQTIYTHRLAFELANGYLPPVVRHTCDNPPCCNPAHLVPGTLADNNRDKAARQRVAGVRNPAAKLTLSDVRSIRSCDTPARVLAAKFGVTSALINMVRSRKVWADA